MDGDKEKRNIKTVIWCQAFNALFYYDFNYSTECVFLAIISHRTSAFKIYKKEHEKKKQNYKIKST